MNTDQLFTVVTRVELPFHAVRGPDEKKFVPLTETQSAAITINWPDGFPCVHAEMYLLDVSRFLTVPENGGSLKDRASKLSHLIRFCWGKKENFWDLYDNDFHDFVEFLLHEPHRSRPGVKRRNRNTVNNIIDVCIHFLSWLQDNVVPNRIIVGPRDRNPQIRLIERRMTGYQGRKHLKLIYPYCPATDTPDPKKPMPRAIRNKLWEAVAAMADPAEQSPVYRARFRNDRELNAHLDYLRARREILLLLLEATGARPGELARLRVSENEDCSHIKRLVLPTLKRRKRVDPKRSIPLERGAAIKLELFIHKHRRALLERLRNQGVKVAPEDRVFLTSTAGTPLSEESLTKDFQRIVAASEVEQQACLSMFRHRFITNMVSLHLKGFMDTNPQKTRSLITDADYRTILKKVATFTGHGSEESLMHYIDWAWEEMGVFDYVQPACDLVNTVEGSLNSFYSLMAEVRLKRHLSSEQIIELVVDELKSIRERTLEAIQSNMKL